MNAKLKYQLFLFYPVHLGSAIGLFVADYSVGYFLIFILGWILIHGYGTELALHRYLSHKSFTPKSIFVNPLLYVATLSIQGPILGWASVHRHHHRTSDLLTDPHSPVNGYWYSWHGWTNDWLKFNTKSSIRSVSDLLKKKNIIFFTKHAGYIIIITYFIIGLIDVNLLFWGLMLPATVSLIQSYNVNLFCHIKRLGYRNFETKDNSANIKLLGFTSWGLGLHNNHHGKPGAVNFEVKKHEFDPAARLLLPIIRKNQ
jgi:fatty-acid desaturase